MIGMAHGEYLREGPRANVTVCLMVRRTETGAPKEHRLAAQRLMADDLFERD